MKAAGNVPFVAKGVLSVQDAMKCKEAGCAGIVISHHHGRIPFGIAPLMVLPKIKANLAGVESLSSSTAVLIRVMMLTKH